VLHPRASHFHSCHGLPPNTKSLAKRYLRSVRVLAPVLALLLACGSSGTDCTLLPTPGGLVPKGCVYEVPSGATVMTKADGSTVVTVNGSVVATYPPCPCPRPDGG